MRQHLTVVAVLHFALSAFGVFAGTLILLGSAAAGAIVGASDTPIGSGLLVGAIGTFIGLFLLLLAVPGLALAYGIFKRRPWAAPLGLVLGVLNLLHFPFGTVIGIYTMWVMLQPETKRELGAGMRAPAF